VSPPDTAGVTQAIITLLATLGRPIGSGALPSAADPPFAVVYPLPGGSNWGPGFTAPQDGAALSYQITVVDVSRAGAETFADTARHALLDRNVDGGFVNPLPVTGLAVLDRELVAYGGVDSDRGVFNVADTYQIHVTRP
jgi:hypothetical protein